MSIVIFHYGKGSFLFNNDYVSFFFQQANVGVSYFFILSGFVMIVAYGNKANVSFTEFITNRLARIYPVYLLALFLTFGLDLLKNNIVVENYLLNAFMLQSWVPTKALTTNGPGWSLSVELFFYITFPILMNKVFSKLKLKINAVWIISFWLASQVIFHLFYYNVLTVPYYKASDISFNPVMHWNEFLIGNLAGLFFMAKLRDAKKNYLPAIVLALVLLILILKFPTGLIFYNGYLAILFVPLILLISLSNDSITKVFSRKQFIFLGEISFGIYILQSPVMKVFSAVENHFRLDKEFGFTILFLARVLTLIAVASVSYVYFEKPLRNKIKTLGAKRNCRQSTQSLS